MNVTTKLSDINLIININEATWKHACIDSILYEAIKIIQQAKKQ